MREGTKEACVALIATLVMLSIVPALWETPAATAGGESLLWVMYKHDVRRTGYVNITPTWRFKGFHTEWTFTANFCISSNPVVYDVNKDGVNEVLVSSCDGYFYVVNGRNGKLLWKFYTGGRHSTPAVGDVNGDGVPDVVVGGENGTLYVLRGTDGKVEWAKQGLFIDVRPALYDFLHNGKEEIIVGSVQGTLYILRWDGKVLRKFNFLTSIILAPSIGDVDGDGKPEVVVAAGSRVVALDPLKGTFKKSVDVGKPLAPGVVLVDVNGDGVLDGVVSYNSGVAAVDLKHGKVIWMRPLNAIVFSPPSVGPVVPNTTKPEVVVGAANGIYVLNLSNGKIIWKYPYLEMTEGAAPILADIDGDGLVDIIAGDARGVLAVLDTVHGLKFYMRVGGAIRDPPTVADADGDGLPEILFGSRDHHLYCLHGNPIQITKTKEQTMNTSQESSQVTSPSSITNPGKITQVTGAINSESTEAPPSFAPSRGPNIWLIVLALVIGGILTVVIYWRTK